MALNRLTQISNTLYCYVDTKTNSVFTMRASGIRWTLTCAVNAVSIELANFAGDTPTHHLLSMAEEHIDRMLSSFLPQNSHLEEELNRDEMMFVARNTVSEKNRYIIPVEWTMFSTIAVEAEYLEEAIYVAQDAIDHLTIPPLCDNAEYVNGSYRIAFDTVDDVKESPYEHIGNVNIDKNGTIHRT